MFRVDDPLPPPLLLLLLLVVTGPQALYHCSCQQWKDPPRVLPVTAVGAPFHCKSKSPCCCYCCWTVEGQSTPFLLLMLATPPNVDTISFCCYCSWWQQRAHPLSTCYCCCIRGESPLFLFLPLLSTTEGMPPALLLLLLSSRNGLSEPTAATAGASDGWSFHSTDELSRSKPYS